MKIERPKSENFLLSVAAQPASQRAVVEAIVRCTTPAELDKLLSGLRFWSWDRGDILCWSPVLNLFDDYLMLYIVNRELGGSVCVQQCRDSLRERSFVFDQLSDAFVLRILHVTFLILENCSNRALYNSSGLLVALLDSFNLYIVLKSLQCLCLFHSFFRNRVRRQSEFAFSSELLLRLPFLCASPIPDLQGKPALSVTSRVKFIVTDTPSTVSSSEGSQSLGEAQPDDVMQDSANGASGRVQSVESSTTRNTGAVGNEVRNSVPSQEALELQSGNGSQPVNNNVSEVFSEDNGGLGELLGLYCGVIKLDKKVLDNSYISCTIGEEGALSDIAPSGSKTILFRELLNGLEPEAIAQMDLGKFFEHQEIVFQNVMKWYIPVESSLDAQKASQSKVIEAHAQELRQKIRNLWCSCHPEARRRLVDIRLTALCAIICLHSQFLLNYLGTCSTLLPDLALFLRHHDLVEPGTLCAVLDLWTAMVQDRIHHRSTMLVMGFSSPHGLFPTLLLKFLGSCVEIDQPIPVCLVCDSGKDVEDFYGNATGASNEQATLRTAEDTTELGRQVDTSNGSDERIDGGTTVAVPQDVVMESVVVPDTNALSGEAPVVRILENPDEAVRRGWANCSICEPPNVFAVDGGTVRPDDKKWRLCLEPQEVTDDVLRMRCRVLDSMMEFISAVVSTSTFTIASLCHTTILQRLVDFYQVLDPLYLSAVISVCRVLEHLIEFTASAGSTLERLLSTSNRLEQRLQYEVAKLASLPVVDVEMARSLAFFSGEETFLTDSMELASRGAITALRDLSTPEAQVVLQQVEEVSLRRCLVRIIFRQLSTALRPSENAASHRLMDLYKGPCCAASRLIFRRPFAFGLSLYGSAVSLLSDYLGEDPSVQPTLIARGLIPDFLASVTQDSLQMEETLQAVPGCLSAILLHHSGDVELEKIGYRPIYTTISVVTQEVLVAFDRVGEIVTMVGSRLDEASRNQDKATSHIIKATLDMVKSIAEEAWRLPPWEAVPVGEAAKLVDVYSKNPPATLSDMRLPPVPRDRYLPDRLANMARFLQAVLRSFGMVMLFSNGKGPEYVLRAAMAPSLPPSFLRVLPYHPLNSLVRMLTTNGIDLSLQTPTGDTMYPSFVRSLVESIPRCVGALTSLSRISFRQCSHEQTEDAQRSSEEQLCLSEEEKSVLCRSLVDLDMAIYLLLAINKDSLSYAAAATSTWRWEQYAPFVRFLCRGLVYLHKAFPVLLTFLYRHVLVYAAETPVVLSTRHSAHDHPGLRASRKCLAPEMAAVQPAHFFWSSLARFAYSVPNPLFELNSGASESPLSDLTANSTLMFEMVRATSVHCRFLLGIASRFINSVPARRCRVYPVSKISVDRYATAAYLALTGQHFLNAIPLIPLPRLTNSGVNMCGPHDDYFNVCDVSSSDFEGENALTEIELSVKSLLHAPGLRPLQTARYIAEVMDVFYRMHVDDKSHGSLFTLTVDTFYKAGGISLVLKGFHYCFGLLVAMVVRYVHETGNSSLNELFVALERLFGVTNQRFIVWIRAMVAEIGSIPKERLGLACDIVSKCLHCCISYCEKITSWKRLYNSSMSGFLQRVCGAPATSVSEAVPGDVEQTPPSSVTQETDVRTNSQGHYHNRAVGDDPVYMKAFFPHCLPPCGSGATEEFDASTLLRSIQGEVTRQTLIWTEGFFGSVPNTETDPNYQRMYEAFVSHFSSKATSCLVKICFHFLDAESPPRKQHTATWKAQHSPTPGDLQERRQQEIAAHPTTEVEPSFCDTLAQLVERHLSTASPQVPVALDVVNEGSGEAGSQGGNAGATAGASNSDTSNTLFPQANSVGVQTDVHLSLSTIYAGFQSCHRVSDWTAADSNNFSKYLQRTVMCALLDLGRRMLSHPAVIAEAIMKLITLPLYFDPSKVSNGSDDGDTVMRSGESPSGASELETTRSNARYVTTVLMDRLEELYSFVVSMDEEELVAYLKVPPLCAANKTSEPSVPAAAIAAGVATQPPVVIDPAVEMRPLPSLTRGLMPFCTSEELCPITTSGGVASTSALPARPSLLPPRRGPSGMEIDASASMLGGSRTEQSPYHGTPNDVRTDGYGSGASPHISPLDSANGTPRGEDALSSAEKTDFSTMAFTARRVHEALHCYFYIFVNLLHRSPTARDVFIERESSWLNFFTKFINLFTSFRRAAGQDQASKHVNFHAFNTKAFENIGVSGIDSSKFLSELRVPTWCLSACQPYLLKNGVAIQAVRTILTANMKKPPPNVDSQTVSPLTLYEKQPKLPDEARCPDWFTCCFLGIEQMLRMYELDHDNGMFLSKAFLKGITSPVPDARLIPVSSQETLLTMCLDVLFFFPALDGVLAAVILKLLILLTSLMQNAAQFFRYSPFPDRSLPCGGLFILLSLPRTAHFAGILRTVSAIVGNLCETKASLKWRMEKELAQYIEETSVLRTFREPMEQLEAPGLLETPSIPPVDPAHAELGNVEPGNVEAGSVERTHNGPENVELGDVDLGNVDSENVEKENVEVDSGFRSPIQENVESDSALNVSASDNAMNLSGKVNDDSGNDNPNPDPSTESAKGNVQQHYVVPLDTLLLYLYGYLRRDPELFKSVLVSNCVFYTERELNSGTPEPLTVSCGGVSPVQESEHNVLAVAESAVPTHSTQQHPSSSPDARSSSSVLAKLQSGLSENDAVPGETVYVRYSAKAPSKDGGNKEEMASVHVSQIIHLVINFLELFTTVQAHTRLTPSFADFLSSATVPLQYYAGTEAKDVSMYPFALLPDSLLFILNDLISVTPGYSGCLLEKPVEESVAPRRGSGFADASIPEGLWWPDGANEVTTLNRRPWVCHDCSQRPPDWNLLKWLMRVLFPKLIALASPASCATAEWKEGERPSLGVSSTAEETAELNALIGAVRVNGGRPTFNTLMHFCVQLIRTLSASDPALSQQCILELNFMLYEMEHRHPPHILVTKTSDALLSALHASHRFPDVFSVNFTRTPALSHDVFSLGVWSAASCLSTILQQVQNPSTLSAAKENLARLQSQVATLSRSSAQSSVDLERSLVLPSSGRLTVQNLLVLRSRIARLLGIIDISAVDSQPLCRALVQCLEFCLRDPLLLLVLFKVPDADLLAYLKLCPEIGRISRRSSLGKSLLQNGIMAPHFDGAEKSRHGFCSTVQNSRAAMHYTVQHGNAPSLVPYQSYASPCNDQVVHDVISPAGVFHHESASNELQRRNYPRSLADSHMMDRSDAVSSPENGLPEDPGDEEGDTEDEDEESSSDAEDIVMEDQEEVIPLPLPHEAEEHEEPAGHFGLSIARRSESVSDSEDDTFDDEEDVPRIRDDDEDAEVMLSLMPDDLSHDVVELINSENTATERSMRLLVADDEDSGTPGLLNGVPRVRQHTADDDEHASDSVTESVEDDDIGSDEQDEHDDDDEGDQDSDENDRSNEREEELDSCSRVSNLSTPNGPALEIVLTTPQTGNPEFRASSTSVEPTNGLSQAMASVESNLHSISFVGYGGGMSNELSDEYLTVNAASGSVARDTGDENVEDDDEDDFDQDDDDDDDDDEGDEQDHMASSLALALPNFSGVNMSEAGHSGSNPLNNDNVRLSVGFDMVLPTRGGDSSVTSLYLSVPTAITGPHYGSANTASVAPLEFSAQQEQQAADGWTCPGDLSLPPSPPILSLSRRRLTPVANADPTIGAGASSVVHPAHITFPYRASFRRQVGSTAGCPSSDPFAPRPYMWHPTPRHVDGESTPRFGHVHLDPWTRMAIMRLRSMGGAVNFLNSSACSSSARPNPPPLRDVPEYSGMDFVLQHFRRRYSLSALEAEGDCRVVHAIAPSREGPLSSRRRVDHDADFQAQRFVFPRFFSTEQDVERSSNQLAASPDTADNDIAGQDARSRSAAASGGETAVQSVNFDSRSLFTAGLAGLNNQEEGGEPGFDSVTETPEGDTTVAASLVNESAQIVPTEEIQGTRALSSRMSVDEAYVVLCQEEYTDPLGFQSSLLRNLALVLGLTQRQLLSCVGADASFFSAMPEDIQLEILTERAPSITRTQVSDFQRQNFNFISAIDTGTLSAIRAAWETQTGPDSSGIRLLPAEPACSAHNASGTLETEQLPDEPMGIEETPQTVDVADSELVIEGNSLPCEESEREDHAEMERSVPSRRCPLHYFLGRRVDSCSIDVPANILAALSGDVQSLRLQVTEADSDNATPYTALNGPSSNAREESRFDVSYDNANFLATLDPALREELLLTATDEDLRALPPQYVAEAAALRDRARQNEEQASNISLRDYTQLMVERGSAGASQRPVSRAQQGRNVVLDRLRQFDSTSAANDGDTRDSLHRFYTALVSTVQYAMPRGSSNRGAAVARPPAQQLLAGSNGAMASTADMLAHDIIQDVRGFSLRPGPTVPVSSSASQRVISDTLDQILGDIDISVVEFLPSCDDHEGNEPVELRENAGRLLPRRNRYLAPPSRGVNYAIHPRSGNLAAAAAAIYGVASSQSSLRSRRGGLPHQAYHDSYSTLPPASASHVVTGGGSLVSHPSAALRSSTDVVSAQAFKFASAFDVPLDKIAVLVVCRLLFLKRQIYRRDMHRLFFNLAATHASTRHQLLQLLMVIIWSAAPDVQQAFRLPPASRQLRAFGFPPTRLYSAIQHSASLLFDSHPEAAASIAGFRALEHMRSLLELVPHVSQFFGTLVPHPACVVLNQSCYDAESLSSASRRVCNLSVVPMEDDNTLPQEFRRKKKKRDSGTGSWTTTDLTHCNSLRPTQAAEPSKLEATVAESCTPRRESREEVCEYPINVLLTLTGSALFRTSSNHMLHLLSAIYSLLYGTQQQSSSLAASGREGARNSAVTPPNTRVSVPNNNSTVPPLETSTSHARGVTGEPHSNVPSIALNSNGGATERAEETGNATSVCVSSTREQQMSAARGSSTTTSDKILQVVSEAAASTVCRLFTGVPLGEGTTFYSPVFLNFSYVSLTHPSPLPTLTRIIVQLYWSRKHHQAISAALLSSISTLVQFISSCLAELKAQVVEIMAVQRQQQSEHKADLSLDFLPPEHLRTSFDTALTLLLRLVISLQDVFWDHPLAPAPPEHPPSDSEVSNTAAQRTVDAEPSRQPASASETSGVAPAPVAALSPPAAEVQVPQASTTSVAHRTGTVNGENFDNVSVVSNVATQGSMTVRQEAEDVASLAAFRDLLDAVGMPALWRVVDELLRDIEVACPFLSRKATSQFAVPGSILSSPVSPYSDHSEAEDAQREPRRSSVIVGANPNGLESGFEASNRSRTAAVPSLSASSLSGTPESPAQLNPPLIVNQLLPLISCYLLAQQVSIAADLGFMASEVPRVVSYATGSKINAQSQQRFSEKVAQLLLNPEGKSTKRHSEMLAFCERHRRILNVLIQHSSGILSTAFQPLIALAPMCISFENKRQYFRQRLKQLREKTRYEPIRLNVRRNVVFMDSFRQLRMRTGEEMKGKLYVHFQGEEGIDAGGLTREWFGILAKEMFNPDYALFRREGTKSEFNHPNPLSHVNPDHLCFFKFVGRVIGKAIYDGQHLGSYFTRSFYKHMLGRKVSPSDAECIDPELYKNLQILLTHNINDLGLDLWFSTDIDEFGRTQVVDLIPNGRSIPVTEETKHEYVKLVCEHKISQGIRPQLESFLKGFHELIPSKFLTIFDDRELELLISGISFVDVNDLRANTVYHGYEPTSPQIYWFWDTLEEMDQNRLATFLQFVTGTSRVPLGGFRELMGMCGPQKFSIHKDYDKTRLPSAHTCFNQLDLPLYPSKEVLREKLLQAISEGSEGFGFA